MEGFALPRQAIARDFLADYSRLENSVQAKLSSAIGKVEFHSFAGAHPEKLEKCQDDRIRSIRTDIDWRGVILTPESGDTYCLITVLRHDKATEADQAAHAQDWQRERPVRGLQPGTRPPVGLVHGRVQPVPAG